MVPQPLREIDRLMVEDYRIVLENVSRFRIRECVKFVMYLEDKQRAKSDAGVFEGLFSSGRGPIKPWLDVLYTDRIHFSPDVAISLYDAGLSFRLFPILGKVIPAGGHFMVAYDGEDAVHRATERALALSFPAFVTPLGCLLVQAGFFSIRDWYWPEGGCEGPRKLWAERPLTAEIAANHRQSLLGGVEKFLRETPREGPGRVAEICREAANRVRKYLAP